MKHAECKLTLHALATYQITVAGHLDPNRTDWNQEVSIGTNPCGSAEPATTVICTTDQAGLMGLLRQFYTLGLPLVAVELVTERPDRMC